jgi:cyclohexyl-isocyanide hydratase
MVSCGDKPMPNKNDTKSSVERRRFLRGAALAAGGLAVGPALAQNDHSQHQQRPMHGVLGAAGSGTDRPKIAMLVHPKLVLQDLVGPMTVFNLMHSEIHLVWKTREMVPTEVGIPLHPTTTFADCPKELDILCVPGGLEGSIACMDDSEVIDFLADRGSRAKYVTSVCTGSLLLGAAGLLKGYKATSHWYVRDQLALFGATPVNERIVHDRNRITGGGVTAGIDFGLLLASMIRSQADAERFQLVIEYAPQPPFNAGTPETAPKAVYERVATGRAPAIEQSRLKAEAIAARWRRG